MDTPSKPEWLRIRPPTTEQFDWIRRQVAHQSLHTVCQEAHCPNMTECWSAGTATFMVLGDTCTRGCRFCAVKTGRKGLSVDPFEPEKLAATVTRMNLRYVVITSVDRDDLPDQGAHHFAACVSAIKQKSPATIVEVLTPDFGGDESLTEIVANSGCEVFGHNIETVRRLQSGVRDRRAHYDQSLRVLLTAKKKNPDLYTKSGLMLGLGEKTKEVEETFDDLLHNKVSFLSLGQYLAPSQNHLPVFRFVPPAEFSELKSKAISKGFLFCQSGPLVRSSYKAGEFFFSSEPIRKSQQSF
ncbi:MAG: lipoyl synthase [Candidatus Diapherotrites archaeon]|uniref:Lipoyl synthase n=1 Tax=Candidatus Iainarchaeum sp. TaxID=3101447 RepID=A0A8T4L5X7_9ARCH|nr:lipoyl synthase [Candidatus Diapherotrites archaeon]